MNRPTVKFVVALLFLVLISAANKAYGCSCRRESPCAVYGNAKAVFVGRMIGGTEKNVRRDQYENQVTYEAGQVRFEIEEPFKGVSDKEVIVLVDTMKGTSCYWPGFSPGERYLIFAREYQGKLVVGPCSSSKRIGTSRQDASRPTNFSRRYWYWEAETGLTFLRSLSAAGTDGRLYATAKMLDEETSIRSATIVLSGQGNSRFEAVTDEYGEAVINLPPGRYTATTNWPKDIAGWHEPEIEISERGCTELKLTAYHTGRVSGRVLDGKGQPVKTVSVYAVSASDQEKRFGFFTAKEDGSFEIGDLPPGKYHLCIRTDREEAPPYFYPGVFEKAKAKTITIPSGEGDEGLEFKLPTAFETQTIKGKVTWPDGKPAAKALVYLKCPIEVETHDLKIKLPEANAITDSEGNFTLTGFKGVGYSLKVVIQTGDLNGWSYKDHVHAPLLRLMLADEPIELRLILSETGYGPDCDNNHRMQE